jgi:hypothetical protein
MAHTVYTGKSGGTTVKIGTTAIPRWKQIVVKESGRPLPEPVDITDADDLVYTFMDNPLGGKGTPKCTITVSGLKSKTDKHDAGVLTATAIGATVTVKVQKATGAGKDLFTMTDGKYMSLDTPHELATIVPFTATFEDAVTAGVWSASAS